MVRRRVVITKEVEKSGLPNAMIDALGTAVRLIDEKNCAGARLVISATRAALVVGVEEAKRRDRATRWADD